VLVLLVAFLATSAFAKVRFDGHKVVHVPWASADQIEKIEQAGLDIWANYWPTQENEREEEAGLALDVMVTDDSATILTKLGLSFTVKIPDVQANMDREEREIAEYEAKPRPQGYNLAAPDDWYTSYHNYSDYITHIKELESTYPNLVTYTPSIGKTIGGLDIPAFVIHSKASTVNRYIHLLGGQHAREWVGPATTLYVAEQLLVRHKAGNTAVVNLLNRAAFHVVPLLNADGYTYTWAGSGNRNWRKNRRLNSGGTYGVDLNRNWDDGKWGTGGSSSTPSSDTYMGTAPFSEPESKAVAAYVQNAGVKFHGAIDYHSYSQLILRPAGWTNTPTANETVLAALGTSVRAAILASDNKAYTSQRSYQLYQTTGTSTDYWYYKSGIVFSYCIELRDTGTYGFQLPANQILPTGRENFEGLLVFSNYVVNNAV